MKNKKYKHLESQIKALKKANREIMLSLGLNLAEKVHKTSKKDKQEKESNNILHHGTDWE